MLMHLLDTAMQASNALCRQPFYSFASVRRDTRRTLDRDDRPLFDIAADIEQDRGAWHIARNLCHREANSAELD
ncbi:hypothetical protein P3C58_31740 [Mesorhizobium sp. XAP10]|uniref:hypothetical protein n=1 Tax=unclassified Mesorhizobium TaxID=325217 RepID=UPI0023DEB914|nr:MULTISPECIES: hypothetical protein [unclassified Mesorhizobium]MDF3156523.1 hypothetical protein [Mesorhizobium sp. XAP10]MDF3249389.1 hypothetical protein [Mesorhizobium sp. XAP4]